MAMKRKQESELLHTKHAPAWLRNPATVTMPNSVKEFVDKSNAYFEECCDTDTRPTITGYALAIGLPGPTSLIRLGQRIPELRYIISRCMTAIAYGYEEMIGYGNAAGVLFMLKNIPDFDPDEPIGAPPIQFFNDRKEVLLTMDIANAASAGDAPDADPVTVYLEYLQKEGKIRAGGTTNEYQTFKFTKDTTYDRRPALEILSDV